MKYNINECKKPFHPHNKCPYSKIDNKNLTNCTYGDGHIGLCTQPCPYLKQLLRLLCVYGYIVDYAVFYGFSVKEGRNKLCFGILGYTHICIEAEGDGIYVC